MVKGKDAKVEITMQGARTETETALNVCIQKVLDRTGLKNNQVTYRAVSCYPPSPLLTLPSGGR